ncbi:MAG TPA: hypothetical protein VL461_02960 [Dictyobacter sp.]|jgi:hypothetical protein|nr:hypothetical protein [Dictyobacter sp.]
MAEPEISPATERAERLLDRTGERIGYLMGRTNQRVRRTTTALRERIEQRNADKSASSGGKETQHAPSAHEANQAIMERAEHLVDRVGQNVGSWSGDASHRMQWMFARVREDLEDMWVEAQHMRRH